MALTMSQAFCTLFGRQLKACGASSFRGGKIEFWKQKYREFFKKKFKRVCYKKWVKTLRGS